MVTDSIMLHYTERSVHGGKDLYSRRVVRITSSVDQLMVVRITSYVDISTMNVLD